MTSSNHHGRIIKLEEHVLPKPRNAARERADEHTAIMRWTVKAGGRADELRRAYYGASDELLALLTRADVQARHVPGAWPELEYDFTPDQRAEHEAISGRIVAAWQELHALWVAAGSPVDRRFS